MKDSQSFGLGKTPSATANPRATVFISHATPDDNEFVRWLGSRLTGHGYKVWADLFELKGGSPFWSSIEDALRNFTVKVIFVVSSSSVDPARSGVRSELSVADAVRKTLKDPGFIIPVRIDSTPFGELPIQIHQLNAIDFSQGWGPKLIELLDTLEHAEVPRSEDVGTPEFENWRQTIVSTSETVQDSTEQVLTNLLPITSLPDSISFYEHGSDAEEVRKALANAGAPFAPYYRLVISFADLSVLQEAVGPSVKLSTRAHLPLDEFLSGKTNKVTAPPQGEAKKMLSSLLKKHIELHLVRLGLARFEMASGDCFFFPLDLIGGNKIPYRAASGRNTNKNVVGRSERNKVYWHLAMKVNVVLGELPIVRFKPYICFSEDGKTALNDAKRTSAIRRRFCRNWWNQHWRQLQEAFCVFLASGKDEIEVDLGGPEKLILSSKLMELVSPKKMPGDFSFLDETMDPLEPETDEDDDLGDLEDLDVENAS